MLQSQWGHPLFKETAILILGIIFAAGILLFPFRNKNANTLKAWHSLQSWLIGAPLVFLLIGSGHPWPYVGLAVCGIFACKEFFQMTGMYHRNTFVWSTYASVIVMTLLIMNDRKDLFDQIPVLFLGFVCLLPIIHNNAKNMIQYIALGFLACNFMGWAFLHLGWLLRLENGPYYAIYLVLLTEVSDNTALAISKISDRRKILENIVANRTIDGIIVSIVVTILVGWGMRHLLPDRSVKYWLVTSLTAIMAGGIGGVVLSYIRRDLGLRGTGAFIIGRGGILDRIDRLIFAAPIYYYILAHIDHFHFLEF